VVSRPADLNVINANLQLNDGTLSFRLRRFCQGTTVTRSASSFNGISLPGTQVGNMTFFALSPSQVSTSSACDPNASCSGGQCVCNPGFVGSGQSCTPCSIAGTCAPGFACPGGSLCGTTCNPGLISNGTDCVPNVSRVVTVQQQTPDASCLGTQLGTYSASSGVTCSSACQQGPASTSTLCGTSLGVPTFCCYRPTMLWAANANPQAAPQTANILSYPYISIPVPSTVDQPNMCLTSAAFTVNEAGTGCTTSQFQLGFVPDSDWDNTLTWNQITTLQAASKLIPTGTVSFSGPSLGSFSAQPRDLDQLTVNLRQNNGRLSMFVKRWCNASALNYAAGGIDDNAFSGNNFGLVNVNFVTCDPNAACANAACVCNNPFFGNGFSCAPATCTGNVATGFFFDASEVIQAGQNATTASCAPGLAGTATRRCLWNGPTSASGVWAEPFNNCKPVTCPVLNAFNATFASVLIGSSAGACRVGFAGTISALCLLNSTTGSTGYWSNPVGSCTLITCDASTFAFASWPTFAPFGVTTFVNGTCNPGYEPTNPTQPTQRQCPSTGTYLTTLLNPCIRINCTAQSNYDNAAWPLTQSDTTVAGTCLAGYFPGSPLRYCGLDGQWATTVVNPCQAISCAAIASQSGMSFPQVNAGLTATGACLPGYSQAGSAPTLECDINGNWAVTATNPCLQNKCAATNDNNAAWPLTVAGNPPTLAVGTCNSGYFVGAGAPYRGCDIDGNFATVENACQQIICPAITAAEGNATWPAGAAGNNAAAGVCLPGFAGSPTRPCTGTTTSPGVWGPVTAGCERTLLGCWRSEAQRRARVMS
jgi:hypothetical protein